jgi:hypothetical protein
MYNHCTYIGASVYAILLNCFRQNDEEYPRAIELAGESKNPISRRWSTGCEWSKVDARRGASGFRDGYGRYDCIFLGLQRRGRVQRVNTRPLKEPPKGAGAEAPPPPPSWSAESRRRRPRPPFNPTSMEPNDTPLVQGGPIVISQRVEIRIVL